MIRWGYVGVLVLVVVIGWCVLVPTIAIVRGLLSGYSWLKKHRHVH